MTFLTNSFRFGASPAALMAPFYHAASSMNAGTAGATLGGSTPGYQQPNDIAVLFVTTVNEAITSTLTTAGWTLKFSGTGTGTAAGVGSIRLYMLWARVDSSNAYPSVGNSGDSGNNTGMAMIFVRGCVTSGDPFESVNSALESTGSTSLSFPTATTSGANRFVINAAALGIDSLTDETNMSAWSNSSLSGSFEVLDKTRNTGNGGGLAVAYGLKQTAGSVSATTATSAASCKQELITATLLPATGTPYVGNKEASGTNSASLAADTIRLLRVVPSVDMTISGLSFVARNTAATAKQRAVIFSDSAGAPNTLIDGAGTENTGVVSGTTYTLPFSTTVNLTAGTPYWIGVHAGVAAVSIGQGFTDGGAAGLTLCRTSSADTYGDGTASPYVGGATAATPMTIWTNP